MSNNIASSDLSLSDLYHKALAYFDSRSVNYPYGISRSYLIPSPKFPTKAEAKKNIEHDEVTLVAGKNAQIYFVRIVSNREEGLYPYSGKEGSLLKTIIEKGLVKTVDDVGIFSVLEDASFGDKALNLIKQQLRLDKLRAVILLGDKTCSVVCGKDFNYKRGDSTLVDGIKILPTHDLASVLRDPSLKKEFWEDVRWLAG